MSNKPSNAEQRRRQAAFDALHAAFPLAFPLDDGLIRPLAISTRDDVLEWLDATKPGLCRRSVMATLHKHCARLTYKRTLLEPGAMRINLQGHPVEPVAPEAAEQARLYVEQARQRRMEADRLRAEREVERAAELERIKAEAAVIRAAKEALRATKLAAKTAKPKPVPTVAPPPPSPKPVKAAPAIVVKKRRMVAVS